MIVGAANAVMALCLVTFAGALGPAVYHQWAKRGTLRGLLISASVGGAAMGLFIIVGWLSQPYR